MLALLVRKGILVSKDESLPFFHSMPVLYTCFATARVNPCR